MIGEGLPTNENFIQQIYSQNFKNTSKGTELNPPAKENLYVSTARAHEFRQWLDR